MELDAFGAVDLHRLPRSWPWPFQISELPSNLSGVQPGEKAERSLARTAIRLADFEIGERGWLVHVLYRDEGIRSAFDALWNLCRHAIERCAATKATSLKVNADGVYARSSPSELAPSPLIRSSRMPSCDLVRRWKDCRRPSGPVEQ